MPRLNEQPRFGRVRIAEIATLRGGFVPSATESRARKRQEEELSNDDVGAAKSVALQPSALRADGTIAWEDVVAVPQVRTPERYLIRDGDLLLPLRSIRIQAIVARDVPPGVIAMGTFVLLTANYGVADIDYLAWYLNQPETRRRLAGTMMGTSLQFLTVRSVGDFEVDLPDLDTQRRIGRVAKLSHRISLLEARLYSTRQQLFDALGMTAVDRAISARRRRG